MESLPQTVQQAREQALENDGLLVTWRDEEHRFTEELLAWRNDVDSWGIHQALNAHRAPDQQRLARWRMAVAMLAHHPQQSLEGNAELMATLLSSERPYDPKIGAASSMVDQLIPIAEGLRGTWISPSNLIIRLRQFLTRDPQKSDPQPFAIGQWLESEGGSTLAPARLLQLSMVTRQGTFELSRLQHQLQADGHPGFDWGEVMLEWMDHYRPGKDSVGELLAPWGMGGEKLAGFCDPQEMDPDRLERWTQAAKEWSKALLEWEGQTTENEWYRSLCNANAWLVCHLTEERAMAEDLQPLLWATCSIAEAIGWEDEDFPLDANGDPSQHGYADICDVVEFSAQAMEKSPGNMLEWYRQLPPSLSELLKQSHEFSLQIKKVGLAHALEGLPISARKSPRM